MGLKALPTLRYSALSGNDCDIAAESIEVTESHIFHGGGGIRTHEALARPTVFKTAPFDRSGTPPWEA